VGNRQATNLADIALQLVTGLVADFDGQSVSIGLIALPKALALSAKKLKRHTARLSWNWASMASSTSEGILCASSSSWTRMSAKQISMFFGVCGLCDYIRMAYISKVDARRIPYNVKEDLEGFERELVRVGQIAYEYNGFDMGERFEEIGIFG
jgi:hypothetical protein